MIASRYPADRTAASTAARFAESSRAISTGAISTRPSAPRCRTRNSRNPSGGAVSGPEVAEVVEHEPVGDVRETLGGGERCEVPEQLGLAVIAALGVVARVGGVFDLVRTNGPVRETELAGHLAGQRPLLTGERCAVRRHGQGAAAQHLVRAHRQVGAVHTA